MSFNGFEIEYNGHLLSDFGGKIGGFNRDTIQEYNALGNYELLDTISSLSPFKRGQSGKYSETLQRECQVTFCTKDGLGIDKATYSEFSHAFFNKRKYCELKFPDDRLRKDYTWMAKLVNPQIKEANGYVYEVNFNIEYNCPYAIVKNEEININSSTTIIHNCESHQDSKIFPNIKITAKDSVIIYNQTNGSKFIVNCSGVGSDYEQIEIDDLLQITTNNTLNNPKLKDVDLTNGKFFYLNYGSNTIQVIGSDISSIIISYPVYKKVGA